MDLKQLFPHCIGTKHNLMSVHRYLLYAFCCTPLTIVCSQLTGVRYLGLIFERPLNAIGLLIVKMRAFTSYVTVKLLLKTMSHGGESKPCIQ